MARAEACRPTFDCEEHPCPMDKALRTYRCGSSAYISMVDDEIMSQTVESHKKWICSRLHKNIISVRQVACNSSRFVG